IAGFPTETPTLFAETLAFVQVAELPFLHVFPYSERPGTPAARMPAVPVPERRERAARLRDAGRHAARRFFEAQVGRTVAVLTENGDAGHSEHFCPVRMGEPVEAGRLVAARVTEATDEGLRVETLSRCAGEACHRALDPVVETRSGEGEGDRVAPLFLH